jgi:hypothetical protein
MSVAAIGYQPPRRFYIISGTPLLNWKTSSICYKENRKKQNLLGMERWG